MVLSCTVMSIQAANFNQKKIKVNEPSFSSYFAQTMLESNLVQVGSDERIAVF